MWSHVGLVVFLAALAAGQEQPKSTTLADASSRSSQSTPAPSPASTPIPTIASTGTCEARSINYVTHTLLQQCLGRTYSPYTTHPANATASATAAGQPAETTATDSFLNNTTHTTSSQDIASDATSIAVTSQSTALPTSTATPLPVAAPADFEEESLLDNAKFLSFEDWKKQNLAEKGFPEPPEKHRGTAGEGQARRHPGINNALDGLGEDAEIEIDFGFGSYEPVKEASNTVRVSPDTKTSQGITQAPKTRSKDAGKTCKERTNYASFDCSASILKTNPKCKSPSSVLVENKDSYMLNECSQENKFLIVELCEGILIDTLVLANFEFFSSMFRTFRVSVSDRYPVKTDKWVDLGTYEARNARDIQPFLIENPQIFARYLRIEFLTHYGSEYYCPISLIRAHGITMFEQYRMEQQFLSGDIDDGEDEEIPVPPPALEAPVPTAVVELQEEVHGVVKTSENIVNNGISSSSSSSASATSSTDDSAITSSTIPQTSMSSTTQTSSTAPTSNVCPIDPIQESPVSSSTATCTSIPVTSAPSILEASDVMKRNTSASATAPTTKQPISSASVLSQVPQTNATSTEQSIPSSSAVVQEASSSVSSPPSSASVSSPSASSTSSSSPSSVVSTSSSTVTLSTPSGVVNPTSSTYIASAAPSAPPAPPATQESFFKSIHKRLSFLEANSTLSLQYIEAQSQLLREAFSKVEKRNVVTTSKFLETLNSTVLAEMARFKGEYEQLWQSTVLELASQRDEGRRERDLLGERVRLLAEEMVSQKRLMAAQAILLLLCLSIVVFAKFGTSAGVDSSLVQGMQELVMMRSRRPQGHKHKASNGSLSLGRRWPWESPWASPPRSRDITRPQTAAGHERVLSMELERGLHDVDADGDADSLGRGSPVPDSPHSQGHSGGQMSSSDTDDALQDRGASIRVAPGVGEAHDGLGDGHDDEDMNDAMTSNTKGSVEGLGLKHISHLDESGSGARLTETRSAPTTPRLRDCASSGSDTSKT